MKHGDGDEGLAILLTDEADRVNAEEPPVPWDKLEEIAERAEEKGADRAALWGEAMALIPASRDDVRDNYEARIVGE